MVRSTVTISGLFVFVMLHCFPSTASTAYQHDDAAMNNRGDHVMGFGHDNTAHHFTLTKTGGIIQVTANDAKDSQSRDHRQ